MVTVLVTGIFLSFSPFFYGTVRAQPLPSATSPLFPNATSAIGGNQSIVPGLHAMSLVNGVRLTWLIISSDNELSVNLRYIGNSTTPPVSLFATALKGTSQFQQGMVPLLQSFQRLSGSNVTSAGWSSPTTIPIRLQGDFSLYDSQLIIVMIVPNTGSIAPGANVTNSSSVQAAPVA
ncbi:MAG TPA: hypothetical protein VF884_10170 [Nitrososphaeraceae archaeon]